MAYNAKALSRMGFGAASDAGQENSSSLFMYRTADALGTTAGQVESTGYFNGARGRLHKGDVIMVVSAVGGTPVGELFTVTASPGTGDVVIAKFRDLIA